MRPAEAAVEVTRHPGAALARGALDAAVVAMLRRAATPAVTPDEHATRVAALRGAVAGLDDPLHRAHVVALVEAALAAEATRRLGAGVPLHDDRLGGWMDGIDEPERGAAGAPAGVGALAPGDVARYGTAASAADVDVALATCLAALRDVVALRTAGRDAGDAWAAFEAAAFGLCTEPAASRAARLDARRTLLLLWLTMRRPRPLAAAVLRRQMAIDRARWPT